MRLFWLTLICAMTTANCNSSSQAPYSSVTAAVVQGTVSNREEVIGFRTRDVRCELPSVSLTPFCSGVALSSDAFVTAAHCAGPNLRRTTIIATGPDAAHPTGLFPIATDLRHPNYDPVTRDNDIAIVHITGTLQKTATLSVGAPVVGDLVAVSGFGLTGGSAPNTLRLEGEMKISEVTSKTFRMIPQPSSACLNDSGGGVFRVSDGTLVGIIRSGDATCNQYTDAVRLDAYADFLASGQSMRPTDAGDPLVPANTCPLECTSDDQCPSGTGCDATLGACVDPLLGFSGSLGKQSCSAHSQCSSGVCAADSIGTDSCHCYEKCSAASQSCTAAEGLTPVWLLLLVLLRTTGSNSRCNRSGIRTMSYNSRF